jgi:hypothetical protein
MAGRVAQKLAVLAMESPAPADADITWLST